jgi:hypothetical protein
MDLVTLLQTIVRARFRSVVLFHSPSVRPEAISATVAAHIGKKTTIGRLRSDAISEEEAVFIHDALLEDRALVLIGGASDGLPASLLQAWESFAEMPRHAYAQAGRFIHFEPDDVQSKSAKGEDVLGTLILVLPKDYPHRVDPRARRSIGSLDELGLPAPPLDDIRDLGRPAVAMSMKTLYFLHHRDPADAEPHESVSQIMKGERPLTWSDLRSVLQQQADNDMFDILEGFGRGGRLSEGGRGLRGSASRRHAGQTVDARREAPATGVVDRCGMSAFLEAARGGADTWRRHPGRARNRAPGESALRAGVPRRGRESRRAR